MLGHPTVELPQRWDGQEPVNVWKWKEVRVPSRSAAWGSGGTLGGERRGEEGSSFLVVELQVFGGH